MAKQAVVAAAYQAPLLRRSRGLVFGRDRPRLLVVLRCWKGPSFRAHALRCHFHRLQLRAVYVSPKDGGARFDMIISSRQSPLFDLEHNMSTNTVYRVTSSDILDCH